MRLGEMTTLLMLSGTVLGAVASYAIGHGWVPDRYLLQPGRQDWARFKGRLPLTLANLAVVITLSAVSFNAIDHLLSRAPLALGTFLVQLVIVLVVDDTWFYFMHRAYHRIPFLYRRVHRVHHKAFAPLPLDYLHVHPVEWITGSTGILGGFGLVWLIWGELSVATVLSASAIKQLHELHVHTGLRAIFLGRIPLLGTVDHHDLHHAKPNEGNYGTALKIWDQLLGTLKAR